MPKSFVVSLPIVFLIVSLLLIVGVQIPSVKAEPVWLIGWDYRKSHVINSAPGAGTDYQIKIIVHYGSGTDSGENVYSSNHCKTDFGDIRFTDNDKTTLLDYWMEEKTDSDNATFWVEVADSLSSSDCTIYVYYGKNDATTTSNGTDTWVTWYNPEDDTEGNDPSGWSLSQPSGTDISISTDQARFDTKSVKYNDTTGSFYCLGTLAISETSLRILRWSYFISPLTSKGFGLEVIDGTATDAIYIWQNIVYGGDLRYYNGSWRLICSVSANVWHRLETVSVASSGEFNIKVDGTWYNDLGLRGSPSRFDFLRYVSGTSTTPVFYHDIVAIGKYVDPEPSHGAWGNEETTLFVTFYNNTGGILRVNNVTTANGTVTWYDNQTIIELVAIVEGNLTYGFGNFTWDSTYNISNPYNYTVIFGVSNLTLWCYFAVFADGISVEERAFGTLGFVVAVIALAIGVVVLAGKKLL